MNSNPIVTQNMYSVNLHFELGSNLLKNVLNQ